MKTIETYIGEIGPRLDDLSQTNPSQMLPVLIDYFKEESTNISSKAEYEELFKAFDILKKETYVQLGWGNPEGESEN